MHPHRAIASFALFCASACVPPNDVHWERYQQHEQGAFSAQLVEHTAASSGYNSSEGSTDKSLSEGEYWTVSNVIDGDTIDVENDAGITRVRLIGIDTPEIAHGGVSEECAAAAAREYLLERLEGQQIVLSTDPTQDETDRYGRKLRYVWDANGRLVNLEMVNTGYARVYVYRTLYRFYSEFAWAEYRAKAQRLGVWACTA